jgi:SAM-dependent methyltransferase
LTDAFDFYRDNNCKDETTDASRATVLDRIAGDVIRQLNPQRVLDASCGSGLLVKSLRSRNLDAWGLDFSQEAIACASADVRPYCRVATPGYDLGAQYDLVICIDASEHVANDGSFLRAITSITDNLLFASAPRASAGPMVRCGKSTLEWIELFAAYGFAPNIAFDASFASPHALLLQRQAPLPGDVAQLFSECIDRRYLAATERAGNDGTTAAVELAKYKERSTVLEEQLAREREYLDTLRGVHALLMQEVQKLRASSAASAVSAGAIDIDAIVERVRSEIGSTEVSPAEPPGGILQLLQQQTALGASVMRLERRTTNIERRIQELAARIESILQSRTWQALVRLGGILIRVASLGRKGS